MATAPEQQLLELTAEFVRRQMEHDATGHDWWHVWRVRNNALHLAVNEGADLLIVELAALLHDVADWKLHDGDLTAGPRVAREWLTQHRLAESLIDHVCDIIGTLSFKGAGVPTPMRTLEGQIVQDADRLDAIGAIGIARCFAFGGAKGRLIHDPDDTPELHTSFDDYRKKSGPSINHFHEKLLLLKDRMNTPTAQSLAEQRHNFMLQFLDQFDAEWSLHGLQ
jgi:uncharacterized protein